MKVEKLELEPTEYSPNSQLPVLIYRDVLPWPRNEDSATEFLTRHLAWEKRGCWAEDPIRHFHPNSHECYGMFQGYCNLLLGVGVKDEAGGKEVKLQSGDVIVLPAGTAHASFDNSEDCRYIGLYPSQSPRWRNEFGEDTLDHAMLRCEIEQVELPVSDPVTGTEGPLLHVWKEAKRGSKL